jgi:hypothetical protein
MRADSARLNRRPEGGARSQASRTKSLVVGATAPTRIGAAWEPEAPRAEAASDTGDATRERRWLSRLRGPSAVWRAHSGGLGEVCHTMKYRELDNHQPHRSAQRQFVKCTGGAPCRGGADSPLARGSPGCPTDCAPALGPPEPERDRRLSLEVHFSARPAEAPRPDMLRRKVTR